jgi:hypothetical protein
VFVQDSLKKVEISKDGTIASLRLEKEQFAAQMDRQKQELQQLRMELEKVRSWKHEIFSVLIHTECTII